MHNPHIYLKEIFEIIFETTHTTVQQTKPSQTPMLGKKLFSFSYQ